VTQSLFVDMSRRNLPSVQRSDVFFYRLYIFRPVLGPEYS